MSIDLVMPSHTLHPLLFLPSIFPSIRVFSKESDLHIRWPKYWSFGFRICPFNEYSGLISLGWTGWISLLFKGLFKSLLQHDSSKASILRCSTFFTVQLSHPYMTTGKITALTRQTFIGKVMSLSFKPVFSLSSFTFIKRLFKFLFTFCHKGGVICISEVIDIYYLAK